MSKLIYLIPVWSGCEDYLVRSLQVVQNKAAWSVAKLSIFTPTVTLMRVCGWMAVRQLMAYHRLVVLHKTLASQKPVYLYQKVTSGGKFSYKTRQAASCPPGFSFEVSHPTDSGTVRLDQVPSWDCQSRAGPGNLLNSTTLFLQISDLRESFPA